MKFVNQPGICTVCGKRYISKRGHMLLHGHWPKSTTRRHYDTLSTWAESSARDRRLARLVQARAGEA